MEFKFEITLGQVLEITGLVLLLIKWSNKIGKLEQKINLMYGWWVKHLELNGQEDNG